MQVITNEKWLSAVSGGQAGSLNRTLLDGSTDTSSTSGGLSTGDAAAVVGTGTAAGGALGGGLAVSAELATASTTLGAIETTAIAAAGAVGTLAGAALGASGTLGYVAGSALYNNNTSVQNAAISVVGSIVSGINGLLGTNLGK